MLQREDRQQAERSSLIAGLPANVQEVLLDSGSIRTFDRGSTIFLQGEPARVFYIVLEGWVKLYRISHSGAEVVVACFTEGQSFAEAVVLQQANYPVHAEAVTHCRLMTVQGQVLTELMARNPDIVRAILATMYQHFHGLVGQIEYLKAKSGAQRVADFLLDLCPDDAVSCSVSLPYEKSLIAGRLGMKPESLSRAFSRLCSVGVTIDHDTATIADTQRLRAYTEEDPANSWSR
jgi:CRP-like cAMP-binding protein